MNHHRSSNPLKEIYLKLRSKSGRISVWMLPGEKVGYIPVPKVASSSIRNSIRSLAAQAYFPDSPYPNETTKEKIDARIRHSLSARAVQKRSERCFLFSFVRNPVTRLYSCYRDKVVNAENRRDRCTLSRYGIEFGISFDEFIARVAEIPDSQSDQHFRSQHRFLMHRGQLLVDFTGKIESMAEDWSQIAAKIGMPLPDRERRVSGPQVGMSEIPLSQASAEKLMARYETDIRCFGYEAATQDMLAGLSR